MLTRRGLFNWKIMNTPKTNLQLLFESIRHTIATKHQVPKHLTEAELEFILALLKSPEDYNEARN